MARTYYVYILANKYNTVLYIGVTGNLERRLYEHKQKIIKGFSQRYNVQKLVYYEYTNDIAAALTREKQLKRWRREKSTGREHESGLEGLE